MPVPSAGLSYAEFEELLRDALLHLYDVAYLQTHPLARFVEIPSGSSTALRGKLLLQTLLDAIESLRPPDGTPSNSHSWRRYRLLELRYLEALSAADVYAELAISKTQYQRDHARALEAVTLLLWDRWRLADLEVTSAAETDSREFLALSEAEQVASQLSPELVDIEALLRELLGLFHLAGEEGPSVVSLHVASGLRPVYGDRAALRQALLGLLSAALEEGTSVELKIDLSQEGEMAVVDIVRELAPTVAASSCRLPRPSPEIEVARHLVTALGGRVELCQLAPVHTWRAVVFLPLARRPVVLVLDNHPDFVALVSRYLAEQNWRVVGAQEVRQALALALEAKPDVILLDVMLPGQDGWDFMLALRLQEETRNIPVIVCSVLYEPQIARALGASGYLTKPVTQAALLDALARWGQQKPVEEIRG